MREIKFRGKRIDNSEWIYGDYYKKIIYKDSGKGQIIHYIGWQIKDKDGTRWNEYEAVDIETVGEYTGLHDKNGKEIYENVILNNRYLVIKIFTKYILYDILNKDILDGGINADTIEITGEYQKLSENQKRDINKYLQQAKRKIKTKGLAFA